MKRILVIFSVLVFTFMLVGCGSKEKTYSSNGIKVTLDDSFVKSDNLNWLFYLESKDHVFMANRELKTAVLPLGITSSTDYINGILSLSGKTATVKTYNEDGVSYKYAYYESTVGEQSFGYMLIIMEGEKHFYAMNFACLQKNLEKNKDQYFKWAKTIKVE